MRPLAPFWYALSLMLPLVCSGTLAADDEYPMHPDSEVQEGVPQGTIEGPFEWRSEIYPGTVRNYWIYVPAQYDASQPACVMVVQDGLGRAEEWKLPTVLDNLIHQGDVPVTIGIFIDHGIVPAAHEQAQPRFNRSFEYDAMGDRYARFLIEEMLPEVSKTYNLSDDPNDRCIAGASSGAICAFTVAWERPDAFRRVFSTIGTYVGLRGGNEYPVLIRKCENRPMRVYLQDGTNDLDIYAGSWWAANEDMLAALQYAGYDVEHSWGEGGHDGRHGTAILPDALRWLWRDYPEPIDPGRAEERRTDVLIEGENWELLSEGHGFTEGPAVSPSGEVFFTDGSNGMIHRIALDGTVMPFVEGEQGVNGLMFGPDGYLYCCHSGDQAIVRFDAQGTKEVVITDAPCNDLTLLHDGTGYYTDPDNKKVWWFTSAGDRRVVDEGIEFANGVVTSTDQTLLFVADTRGRFLYSYQILPGGDLAYRQEYGHLHRPDDTGETGADGMTVDTEGRIYVTTNMGVQILDQLGRVNFIIDKPQDAWLANLVFGGEGNTWLHATCHDKVFRRRLNATGVIPWQPPVLPPRPGL